MKVKIKIPTSLSEITLKQYQKYLKIADESPDAIEFLNIKSVEIFCNVRIKDVNAIKVSDFEEILKEITATFEQAPSLKHQTRFKYRDTEYGFIPNLEDISMGEYIDLTNYLSDTSTLHKAMAVLYRPITQKSKDMYLIEEYETADKYCDIMKEAPLDVYLGAQVFFYNLGRELVNYTLTSLAKKAGADSQLQRILDENGGGIPAFMPWHLDKSGGLIPSLN